MTTVEYLKKWDFAGFASSSPSVFTQFFLSSFEFLSSKMPILAPVPSVIIRNPPFSELLEEWPNKRKRTNSDSMTISEIRRHESDFHAGTTSIQAADEEGWIVSITPSGGWIPAYIAGRTGIGMSQRMQSFVLNPAENPFNVVAPGKRPRSTLTPGMALKDGRPYLSFAVQAGDTQDQNLLKFFLNVVEFRMNVQQAAEAANITSFQMHTSFGDHLAIPGKLHLREDVPVWVQGELQEMGYTIELQSSTSGPINAIFFDWDHQTMWGGSSNHGEDYGIAW